MTCAEVSRDEIVEKYLLGQLSPESRDAFEQHYFECARCFHWLQTYRDLQSELARTRDEIVATPSRGWVRQWAWLPAAAVVLLAVSVTVWHRRNVAPVETPPSESTPSISPNPPTSTPVTPSLEELARVEPPAYGQGRLRGAADAATATFGRGMDRYQRRDYAGARARLKEASQLDPESPHVMFFLGITNLLTGRTDEAIEALRSTIALGDSPYLEEAHFYLAKAYLKAGRVDDGIGELERTIRLRGDREADARGLLSHLKTFKNGKRMQ
jgi:tetratricopeptide (TPR) repeat protein